MKELAITAANSITAVGHDGRMTSASVRAGICRMFVYEAYLDGEENPITVARIRGIEDGDGNRDSVERIADIASKCLEDMLAEYFRHDARRPSQIGILLGTASEERPGPYYEEGCRESLVLAAAKWTDRFDLRTIAGGNASMHLALEQARVWLESDPGAICIVGGVDTLLRASTLNWFERDGRLKSASYGRHQGLVAGEAVSFMIVEDVKRAREANRQILAHIAGLGLAEEPMPRASGAASRNSGLTDACRAALDATKDADIRAIFGDLNGETSRANEWSMAEMRCFENRQESRKLWNPANCYGDIGAASGAVMVNIATQGFARGWLQSPVLIFCSDDHGSCGALVLERGKGEERNYG